MAESLPTFRKNRHFKILVCGKTGCGKSALINSVFGTKAMERDPGQDQTLGPGQTEVECHHKVLNGVNVYIYDTPGLRDGKDNNEEYLKSMHSKCKNVDLVLFCIDDSIDRFGQDDVETVKLIANKFSDVPNFWKHCILVLTKSNRIWTKKCFSEEKKFQCHKNRYFAFANKFKEVLEEHLSTEMFPHVNIAVVAAGYCTSYNTGIDEEDEEDEDDEDRKLYYVSEGIEIENERNSIRRHDFLPELMTLCACQVRGEAQIHFFTSSNFHHRTINADKEFIRLVEKREEAYEPVTISRSNSSRNENNTKWKLSNGQRERTEKAFHRIGGEVGGLVGRAGGACLGTAVGTKAGAMLGASAGSVVGPAGTIVGLVLGGGAGLYFGRKYGGKAGTKIGEQVGAAVDYTAEKMFGTKKKTD